MPSAAALDNDDETMTRLFTDAKAIAVVGISANPSRDSHSVARYLLDHGYELVPVNPKLEEIFGRKAYPSLKAARDDGVGFDLVDVFRRPDALAEVVDDAVEAAATAIWFQLGVVNEEAARRAKEAGMTVVMDRCTRVEHRRLVP